MSWRLLRRRGTAAEHATFTGLEGEFTYDKTNKRVIAHDGVTAGGNAAAKLSEVVTAARSAVADTAYTVLATDRIVAYSSLTAARAVTLPAASAFPVGVPLWIIDESGSCSGTKTITVNRAGSDTIDGATSAVIKTPYGGKCLTSNGSSKWTIASNAPNISPDIVGINTTGDSTNKLSVSSSAILFNNVGNGVQVKVNKNASGDTGSFLFQTGFSGRAEIGNTGDDDFHFKVSPDGSTWNEGLKIAAASGLVTLPIGQLKFPATQNPSSDVNTLDDYEEGTWLPALDFGGTSVGITYSAQQGRYIKIGALLMFQIRIVLTAKGSSTGNAHITGFPVNQVGGSTNGTILFSYYNNMSGMSGILMGYVTAGTATFVLGGATTFTNMADTNFTNTSDFQCGGFLFQA